MEFFHNAKSVRLKGHHNKFLVAEDDEESVTQDRNGSSKTARWTVEFIQGGSFIRLKSCFGKYLTASNAHFLLGMTGCKVIQSLPRRLDSSVEWEPVKDHHQLKLKTRYGNFLRANGGLPPWRNSVTHDVPQRTATQEWVLWDVDVLEIQVQHHSEPIPPQAIPQSIHVQAPPPPPPYEPSDYSEHDSQHSESDSDASFGRNSSNLQPSDSFARPHQPQKVDGRVIYYSVADDNGDVDEGRGESFVFKGNGVEELTQKLQEETGLGEIIVCTRSPLNGKLIPLRLRLPPNNTEMNVVVVESSSRVGRNFTNPTAL
ncbi:hypothetical protein ACHQM5_008658 [Ranunculus cassubicifolius]